MKKKLAVIILAAGYGKRLGGKDQKVIHKILGKSMISYLMDTVKKINPDEVIVVVGFKKERVIEELKGQDIKFVEQPVPLGTADAVRKAVPVLQNFDGNVLILYGDVPFITCKTLYNFIEDFEKKDTDCSIITFFIDNPTGYGRIVRDNEGNVKRIVEEVNASEEEKRIKEVNSGIYLFKKDVLFDALREVKKDPIKGEYYLTDVIKILSLKGKKIGTYITETPEEVQGINTIEELKRAEEFLKRSKEWTVA